MPNLTVIRPCDAVEVAEAWEVALTTVDRPVMLVLSRQNLPVVRQRLDAAVGAYLGAYEVHSPSSPAMVSIFASGSEVAIAIDAAERLTTLDHPTRVVSIPSFELFRDQPEEHRSATIGKTALNVSIEAAGSFGWSELIGREGIFVGMSGFGASGKAEELYHHFGLTPETIVERVLGRMGQ